MGIQAIPYSGFVLLIPYYKPLYSLTISLKCTKCNTTCNLTILSRVAPGAIPPELLRGFHENDTDFAMIYATDKTLIKRNGAEPGQV